MRNRTKLHALKRPKFRQSWNKYNLYNLTRIKTPVRQGQTFFQQKWYSKSLVRTYHGVDVKEKAWRRMFRPTTRSVVSMNPRYLATHDGSDEAAGRGSGLTGGISGTRSRNTAVPYMNMLFAPLERRLDTAIFRAMFASSLLQARQFCVHGYVKVNGQKMVHPAYNLNPGDMFQVEPERVLFATGATKTGKERRQERRIDRREAKSSSKTSDSTNAPSSSPSPPHPEEDENPSTTPKATLSSLLTQAKTILANPTSSHSAARKRELRDFQRQIKRTLSNPRALSDTTIATSLSSLADKLSISSPSPPDSPNLSTRPPPKKPSLDGPPPITATLKNHEEKLLAAALAEARDNPIDSRKPYATPWRPRPYMSAFAFIPRFLEVHHTICSAVYLRHPVARAGLAEVPTPFATEVSGLAFNWYLRRR
ncbi:mitochondrial 37S ribosomal protein nam9 [Thelotrema lepadinum]|nr:mitochondrial 37S ribosomal protein nam9 [Thelotrema lepadinum]